MPLKSVLILFMSQINSTSGDLAGNTPASATPILLSTIVLAAIDTPGDIDIYRLEYNPNRNMQITFTSLDGTPLRVDVTSPTYINTFGPYWVGAGEPLVATGLSFSYITGGSAFITIASRGGATGKYEMRLFELEEVPPPAPTLAVTDGANPIFAGVGEAWNKINFFVNGGYIGSAQADATGAYRYAAPDSYAGTNNTVYAVAMDLSANYSPRTSVLTFNGEMPNQPVLSTPVLRAPWGTASATTNNAPIFSGTGTPGATLHVYNGTIEVASTVVRSDGSWEAKSGHLLDGVAHLTARQGTGLKPDSPSSAAIDVVIDATAPQPPSLTVRQTGSGHAEVHGHSESDSSLTLLVNGLLSSSLKADALGNFKFNVPVAPDGFYTFAVNAADHLSNTSVLTHLAYAAPGPGHPHQGGSGNIFFQNSAGSDTFDGGTGLDTVVYTEPSSHFALLQSAISIYVTQRGGAGGQDKLTNVERLEFADESIAFDIGGAAGQTYRLYQAALNREPDLAGLGFWIENRDRGMGMNEIAHNFMKSPEFVTLYGHSTTNESFVTALYWNVMHRVPDTGGLAYWLNAIGNGTTLEDVLVLFSESPENQTNVIGHIENGIHYLHS